MNRLLLPLAGIVAGILLEYPGGLSVWSGVPLLVGALAIWAALSFTARGITGRMRSRRLAWMWIVPLFAAVGMAAAGLERPEKAWESEKVLKWCERQLADAIVAVEIENTTTFGYGDRLEGTLVDALEEAAAPWKKIDVRLHTGVTDVRRGDIVTVPASAIGGAWFPAGRVKVVGRAPLGPRLWAAELQQGFCGFIERTPLDDATSRFLCALLAGDSRSLPKEMREEFSSAGLAHILALSGMHVGIIAAMVMGLLWPWRLAGGRRARRVVTLVVLWLFVLLSGLASSTLRAAVMLTASYGAVMAERRRNPGEGWAIAAMAILLLDPGALREAGFQLSFICVGALILFAEPLNPLARRRGSSMHGVMTWLLVPMIATAATWTVSAYWFGKVPLGFMPLNMLAVPLLPGYVGVSVVYLLLFSLGIEGDWMRWLLDSGLEALRSAARLLDGGGATVIDYQPPLWIVLGWLALLGVAGWFLSRRSMRA